MGKKRVVKIFSQEIFYLLTLAVVVFYFLEILWPGIVLAHFKLCWLLLFWLLAGILLLAIDGPNN